MTADVAGLPSGPLAALGGATIDLDAAYAPGVAVLDVVSLRDGEHERFALRGFCCCAELPYCAPVQQQRPGRIDVAELITKHGGESPARTFLRLKSWSSTKVALQRWLGHLRATHGDDLALIVRDSTDYAIPWELFWLQDGEGGGDWLGAAVTLTRWTPMVRAAPEIAKLPPPAPKARGDVVAYVANGAMQADVATLDRLQARLTDSLWDLLRQLDEPGEPLALVYVACHGTFSESSPEFVLDADVSVADVDAARFLRLADSGGLVFANACHSARLFYDVEYHDATLRGFAEAFLRAGATGFIGTVGAVAESQARQFVVELVDRLCADPKVPVAVALRDLRRRYSVRLQPRANDDQAAKALLPFFYTFMYAYFGSPDGLVELPSGAEAQDGPL